MVCPCTYAYVSITGPYRYGANPEFQGWTSSATLRTWIGRPPKIGHWARIASAAWAEGESSVAKTTRVSDRPRATRTGHGAWSTTSLETDTRTSVAIGPCPREPTLTRS